jgi:hypothetical protein
MGCGVLDLGRVKKEKGGGLGNWRLNLVGYIRQLTRGEKRLGRGWNDMPAASEAIMTPCLAGVFRLGRVR